jgi:hypothetical protein
MSRMTSAGGRRSLTTSSSTGPPSPVSRPASGTGAASPAATRGSRPSWRDPRLAVGIGLVAVCALVGARVLGGADDTVAVWSVTSDVVPGQTVALAGLRAVTLRFTDDVDANRYLSADQPLPGNAVLARAVGAGELLPRDALDADGTMRLVELPLSVQSDAVAATVRAGTVVDVWVTPKSDQDDRSVRVLSAVPVLDAPQGESSLGPSSTRQVVVGLDADQQALLPRALDRLAVGTVVLTSRGER